MLEGGGDEGAGRLDAADDLDDDVDVAAFDERGGVGGDQRAGRCPRAPWSGRRTATPASSTGAPMRAARSSACVVMMRATSEPTTPQPSSATFSGRVRIIRPRFLIPSTVRDQSHCTGREFLSPSGSETSISFARGRMTGDLPIRSSSAQPTSRRSRSSSVSRRTITRASPSLHGDDRRAQRVVVVAGHRAAVRAGRRHGDAGRRAPGRRAGTRP